MPENQAVAYRLIYVGRPPDLFQAHAHSNIQAR
jgi:hypothetical protein